MSSSTMHNHLTSSDLTLLEGVLRKAGFRGTEAIVDPDALSDASRFLVDLFRSGNDREGDLVAALEHRGTYTDSGRNMTPTPSKHDTLDRWLTRAEPNSGIRLKNRNLRSENRGPK